MQSNIESNREIWPVHVRPSGRRARVHLLWTGGWDSTFRLLQLLLQSRIGVDPHYIADPTRASTGIELETMRRIGNRLCEAHPHVGELLGALQVDSTDDICIDDDILVALSRIRRRSYIGDQYAWLPAYCRKHGIDGIELGVHVDDKVQALVRPYAKAFAHPAGFASVRMDSAFVDTPEWVLFRDFSFPLFAIDKVGIDRDADAEAWTELMAMTWFCHTPVRGRPCGLCAPCVYTIEEGLARRVPRGRRALSFLYRNLALPFKGRARIIRQALR
jgi:hypothetical protein